MEILSWSKGVEKKIEVQAQVVQESPKGVTPRIEEKPKPKLEPAANISPHARPFPDAVDFAHIAILKGAAQNGVRSLWGNFNWSTVDPKLAFERLLDQRESDHDALWEKMGLSGLLDREPAVWLRMGATVFVVGVYRKLTGNLPSVHVVISLLELIMREDIKPRALIRSLALGLRAKDIDRDALLAAYPAAKRHKIWRLSTNEPVFDLAAVAHGTMILQLARQMARTDWGQSPFEALYNISSYFHNRLPPDAP